MKKLHNFFKKVQKLERKHMHELALMCGSVAVLLMVTTFVSSGIPSVVYAWTIYISGFTYTPVSTGGNTTISWYAGSAQYCTLTGPTFPCTTYRRGSVTRKICPGITTYGTNPGSVNIGNVNTGPITGPTSYTLSCYSPAGCSWWCNDGSGSASLTVYPTAPAASTLTSLTASPASVSNGQASTLSWTGTKGPNFSACELTGGQWGSGAWFSVLPGTLSTNALNTTTTYSMDCFDTTGASTGWRSATITVTAPVDMCSDIPGSQFTLPAGCSGPVPPPTGLCIPTGGSYSAASNSCKCPVGSSLVGNACVPGDQCSNLPGNQATVPPNCTQQSDGTCTANVGYVISGASCVATDLCSNIPGIQTTVPANCTQQPSGACTANPGYVIVGGSCVASGIIQSFTANPSRVRKGGTATISWSTANMSACTLSGFTDTGTTLISSVLSSTIAPVVNSKTIYTLSCTDASGASYASSATVNLIPEVIEQ